MHSVIPRSHSCLSGAAISAFAQLSLKFLVNCAPPVCSQSTLNLVLSYTLGVEASQLLRIPGLFFYKQKNTVYVVSLHTDLSVVKFLQKELKEIERFFLGHVRAVRCDSDKTNSCEHLWSHLQLLLGRKYESQVALGRILTQKPSKLEHFHTFLQTPV